ncbi:MAG: HDOD domain-containing protein [Gammaproteobacteria bacterium]|nr:HDOD domain-containing protein [Gammaproteobacteria bacterium]
MTQFRETIKLDIHFLKGLPPLAPTANQMIRLLSQDDVDIDEISRVIEQDPQLAARLIGLANAAYFGQPRPVCNVKRAIVQALGLQLVKSLVMGIVVHGVFDAVRCPEFNLEAYWLNALATAVLARQVATRIPEADRSVPDCVYLAGLFHDLGKLLLAHLYPTDYAEALRAKRENPELSAAVMERQFVGISRAEAGAWLAKRWALPALIVDVLSSQQDADDQCQLSVMVRLVNHCRDQFLQAQQSGEVLVLQGVDEFSVSNADAEDISAVFNQTLDDLRALAGMLAI